ncbi:MAG: phosphoenolpyruvate carboxylase, partial [Elusimicrobia bacterium]|nr:phosphoenolpyruvate carboxylase [Candidatus Obscuribacterium magneticum]
MNDDLTIPRCMSTQHPDNANLPSFAAGAMLTTEEEIQEAFYAFSELGCDEQMWDHEGKEGDEFVVSKLLTRHSPFFKKKKLGRDVFLTIRVPNPAREPGTAKVLLEILESIPRSFDMAREFYRQDIVPVFEIILPMTTNALELNRIQSYYHDFVAGKADQPIQAGDIKLKEWVGDFSPRDIRVIPLIENRPSMLAADRIVKEYLRGKDLPYVRVFLARSDPAMTYGSTSAVLLIKIALHRLHQLERRLKIPLYPLVGVGSAPFRGNFTPTNIKENLHGYPSVQTFTIQSAFKFDYPKDLVRSAVAQIKKSPRKPPIPVDNEAALLHIIDKIAANFTRQVRALTPLISHVAGFVPSRRMRRLHVGLFGYSRSVGGKRMPRAISFCASFYSVGLPPELLGLAILSFRWKPPFKQEEAVP